MTRSSQRGPISTPDLFAPLEGMSSDLRAQVTYPTHLFHLQFDDLYIYYHMNDPMYFFNLEDMWDDADEVLGPIIDQGKAIRFSIEPFPVMMRTGGGMPDSDLTEQYRSCWCLRRKRRSTSSIPMNISGWQRLRQVKRAGSAQGTVRSRSRTGRLDHRPRPRDFRATRALESPWTGRDRGHTITFRWRMKSSTWSPFSCDHSKMS